MEIKKSKNNVIPLMKKKFFCPTCKKSSLYPFAPFCSKKCADKDLMKWLSEEQYVNLKTE